MVCESSRAVIMGVAGCGKSSLASAWALEAGWAFVEGDALLLGALQVDGQRALRRRRLQPLSAQHLGRQRQHHEGQRARDADDRAQQRAGAHRGAQHGRGLLGHQGGDQRPDGGLGRVLAGMGGVAAATGLGGGTTMIVVLVVAVTLLSLAAAAVSWWRFRYADGPTAVTLRVAGPASWFQTPSTSGTPDASSAA